MPPIEDLRSMFQQARGGLDYSQHFNEMLAPYQAMAGQMNSPYATMSPNSWLARNHPRLAGILDSPFLTAAMTPGPEGPEGAGGGISRTFQGLMGAQQYRREQILRSAMLPYQMLMPQLQARDIMAQTAQREAEAPYYLSRGERYLSQMEQADRPRLAPGGLKVDDRGQEWQEIFDPLNPKQPTRWYNPVSKQYADELKGEDQPTFAKQQRAQRQATGGFVGDLVQRLSSADPAIRAEAEKDKANYLSVMGGTAGARTAGEQEAPHPYSEQKEFLQNEARYAYGTLPKTMSPYEFQTQHALNPKYWDNPEKSYQDYLDQQKVEKQKMDQNLATYRSSGAWKRGASFQEYMAHPEKYDGTAPTTTPSPAGNTGSNWTPR